MPMTNRHHNRERLIASIAMLAFPVRLRVIQSRSATRPVQPLRRDRANHHLVR